MLFVWCMFFMWYLGVEGVILYRWGILWDNLLMFVIVNGILFFIVVVNRCKMVLVDLFMVIFKFMVFLKVLKLVILCGNILLLLLL